MIMLMIAAPILIESKTPRVFLEDAQRLGGMLVKHVRSVKTREHMQARVACPFVLNRIAAEPFGLGQACRAVDGHRPIPAGQADKGSWRGRWRGWRSFGGSRR